MNVEAYEILGVNYDDPLDVIKEKFKFLVLKTHPDKGGSMELFKLISKAYKDIENERMSLQHRKIEDYQTDTAYKPLPKQFKTNGEFDINAFNKMFSDFYIPSVMDNGYGHLMTKSEYIKDDFTSNTKTSEFQEFKRQGIVKYEEPDGINSYSGNVMVLGQESFTSCEGNYSDYMEAYSEPVNHDSLNVRGDYKSIDDLVNERNNIKYTMTDSEKEIYNMKENKRKKDEIERIRRLNNQDKQIIENYQQRMLRLTNSKK